MQFLGFTPDQLKKILIFILLLVSCLGLAYAVIDLAVRIPAHYQYNYAEPVLLSTVFDIRNTPLIYRDLNQEPFIAPFYPPVYYYLSFVVSLITGHSFTCGRIVSFLSAILLCLFIYKILRLEQVSKAVGWIAAALFFLSPAMTPWIVLVKNDMTAALFSLVGIYFMLRHERENTSEFGKNYLMAVMSFGLAFFTKQSFIFGMMAYSLFLLTQKRFRNLFQYTVIQAVVLAAPAVLLNILTNGNFIRIVFLSHLQAFYPKLVLLFWGVFLNKTWWLVIFGALFFLRQFKTKTWGLVAWYLISTLFSTFLSGKIGSDINFFIEFTGALCVATGLIVYEYIRESKNHWKFILAGAVLLSFALCPSISLNPMRSLSKTIEGIESTQKAIGEIEKIIRPIEAPILAEEMGILISSGKKVWYEPFEFTQLARSGRWDEDLILRKLRNKSFAFVILSTNLFGVRQTQRFSENFIKTLFEYYRPVGLKQGYYFYISK